LRCWVCEEEMSKKKRVLNRSPQKETKDIDQSGNRTHATFVTRKFLLRFGNLNLAP
jgi:hypothetical protein